MPGVDRHGRGRRAALFFLIAAFVVAIDQISKLWVRAHLALGESLPETGFARLTYVENTGSAFGLFANQPLVMMLVAAIGVVVILLFYRHLSQYGILGTVALGLVLGGAAGNLVDRFRFGSVTDFFDVRLWQGFHWPAFNVADSAITVGVIALVYFIFRVSKKENGHPFEARS